MHDQDDLSRAVADARSLVDAARRIVLLTGAGISTDSGIPDFRGPDGLWTKHPGAERASHIDVFLNDASAREATWAMVRSMADPEKRPRPNAGHASCARLHAAGRVALVVTQNIDGLHQLGGLPQKALVEVHGSFATARCSKRCAPARPVAEVLAEGAGDPRCRACGAPVKPSVVLFGEQLDEDDLARAFGAANKADLVVAVGTSLTVSPCNQVVPVAKQGGAKVVIVNATETAMDGLADVLVREPPISEALPLIFRVDPAAVVEPAAADDGDAVVVGKSGALLREGVELSSPALATLPRGARVRVLERALSEGGVSRLRIACVDGAGWVSGRLLRRG
jgi:NAD-dependent deacetylase